MGKGKLLSRFTALFVVLGLMIVPLAGAYNVPRPPGKPGGPPTKSKGGTKGTKKGVKQIGVAVEGFTGSELAKKGKVTIKVFFPSGGAISGKITAAGQTLASGTSSKSKKGKKNLTIKFTKSGKKFLNSVNGQAIKLTLHFTFNPNKGKTKSSTATITLDK